MEAGKAAERGHTCGVGSTDVCRTAGCEWPEGCAAGVVRAAFVCTETAGNGVKTRQEKHGRLSVNCLNHKSWLPALLLLPPGSWQQPGNKDEALPAIHQRHRQGSSAPSPGTK